MNRNHCAPPSPGVPGPESSPPPGRGHARRPTCGLGGGWGGFRWPRDRYPGHSRARQARGPKRPTFARLRVMVRIQPVHGTSTSMMATSTPAIRPTTTQRGWCAADSGAATAGCGLLSRCPPRRISYARAPSPSRWPRWWGRHDFSGGAFRASRSSCNGATGWRCCRRRCWSRRCMEPVGSASPHCRGCCARCGGCVSPMSWCWNAAT